MAAVPTAPDNRFASRVAQVLDRAVERGCVGASVSIVRHGDAVCEVARGSVSLELDVAAGVDSVFPIASITKVFTATLVLIAIEEGRLGLGDTLGDKTAAPSASGGIRATGAWSAVTVRQLLTHTSGLPDVIVDPMTGEWIASSREEALTRAGALPLQFEAGTDWSYNQTNYVLLGQLLEDAFGKGLEELIAERILEPLELKQTTFGDSSAIVSGRGPWYTKIDFSGPEPRLAAEPTVAWVAYPEFTRPCAGLNTTAAELARFVDALAAGRMVSETTRDAMWAPQRLRDGSPALADPTTEFGLGWMIESLRGESVAGATGGAACALRHAIGSGTTVVVLTNTQGSNPDGLAVEILDAALGDD